MKVIIDIDEDVYRYIKDTPYLCNDSASIAARCIKNGIVLSERGVDMTLEESLNKVCGHSCFCNSDFCYIDVHTKNGVYWNKEKRKLITERPNGKDDTYFIVSENET